MLLRSMPPVISANMSAAVTNSTALIAMTTMTVMTAMLNRVLTVNLAQVTNMKRVDSNR